MFGVSLQTLLEDYYKACLLVDIGRLKYQAPAAVARHSLISASVPPKNSLACPLIDLISGSWFGSEAVKHS